MRPRATRVPRKRKPRKTEARRTKQRKKTQEGSVGSNDFSIEYDKDGPSLIIELFIEKVIADWWVRHVVNDKTVQAWQGRTDDAQADVAPVNVATLTLDSSLNWVILLYAPNANMTVAVTVDVRQGSERLGSKSIDVSLAAKKATQEAGTIVLSPKAA
jgi:hypothetical protein